MSEKTQKDRKPLLWGNSYATDVDRLATFREEIESDPGWIPGYSEQVVANELAKIDPTVENFTTERRIRTREGRQLRDHYFAKYGEPKPLPVKFMWIRVVGMDGTENQNVRTDMIRYTADGYRFATMEDLQRHDYGMPPAATLAADGTIRRGDVALAVVDAERARAIQMRKARENAEREGAATQGDVEVMQYTRETNYVL